MVNRVQLTCQIQQLVASIWSTWASLVAQLVKNPPATQETWVWSLHWKDPLEKGKATHSSVLACRIPWTIVHGVYLEYSSVKDWEVMARLSSNKCPDRMVICCGPGQSWTSVSLAQKSTLLCYPITICLYVCHSYGHTWLQESDRILFIFGPSIANTLELPNSNLLNDWETRSQEVMPVGCLSFQR